ncbi:major allergen Pru ar 1 [Jatropha curcas]|uniref:major allergen Pru ar 1 n=1 Tax=Jatropha curcas TaxID=180498 RepID=UPI0018944406|nr:major allergen Pru ar 1 [Jatropha curcas]
MAALIHEDQIATAISPAMMFKVFVLEAIKSIEIIEGNGGPGTIKKTTFVEGSIAKSISKYYANGDAKIDQEKIKAGEQQTLALFKVIETYLLANPDAY